MKNHVFISYSSRDTAFVQALTSDLQKSGLKVWLDEARLTGGDSLVGKLDSAIREAAAAIVVLSTHSVQSRWVQKEIELAVSKEIATTGFRIVPVLLEPVEAPVLLSGKVQIDFSRSQDYRSNLKKLLRALGKIVDDQEPEGYGLAFLNQLKAALALLRGESRCHVAPSIPEKVVKAVRESCQISPTEEIYAVITKFGWIYGGPFADFGPFGSKGKEALIFTQRGIYGAGYTHSSFFSFVPECKLKKTFRELKETEVTGYVTEHSQPRGGTSYTYYIKIDEFSMALPWKTRNRLIDIAKLIETL
jgi:hypothetical protein